MIFFRTVHLERSKAAALIQQEGTTGNRLMLQKLTLQTLENISLSMIGFGQTKGQLRFCQNIDTSENKGYAKETSSTHTFA